MNADQHDKPSTRRHRRTDQADAVAVSPRRFENLDGFRGVCAAMVAIFHCDAILNTGRLLNHGYLGVDAFFVLSGFVIALTYEDRLRSGMGGGSFLKKRWNRLIPTHVMGTAVVSLVTVGLFATGFLKIHSTPAVMAMDVALGFLLIPSFGSVGGFSFPVNSVLWSLSCEWIVNIAYGLLLFRSRARWLLLAILVSWSVALTYGMSSRVGLHFGTLPGDFWLGVVRAFAGFLCGTLIFRLHRNGKLRHFPSVRPELVFSLFFLACAIPTKGPTPIFDFTMWLLLPLAVILLVKSDEPVPRFYLWLGVISYPLYVSQLASIRLVLPFLDPSIDRHSMLLAIPMLAGAVGVAILLTWLTKSRQASVLIPGTLQPATDT
jgi:peptidoglycan/LPS O-acetylase OafA/YrhL